MNNINCLLSMSPQCWRDTRHLGAGGTHICSMFKGQQETSENLAATELSLGPLALCHPCSDCSWLPCACTQDKHKLYVQDCEGW